MTSAAALLDVLEQLANIVPAEHVPSFRHIHGKIEYTAPELIGTRWYETYELLNHVTPADAVGTVGTWVESARNVWNKAHGHGSSTNTAAGSSSQ